jgi:diguanylate cyclase (GGDEF)-like protein
MVNKEEFLNIIGIGLDDFSIEAIKKALKENKVKFNFCFLQDVGELEDHPKRNIDAVFFHSSRQSIKTIQEIRKINSKLPRVAIVLLSPRADHHVIVGAFRTGLFDFLTLPIDQHEIRTVIYRLQLHEVIQSGKWSPERAVLHLFSRPENFSSIKDVASSLDQYINLFFKVEKEFIFTSVTDMVSTLSDPFRLSEHHVKGIRKFLADQTGLIFGLRFIGDKFHFLMKKDDNKFSYLVVKNNSEFEIKDIMNAYLSNVIRTSLTILFESKRSEEIRMLSMTDEVTGLFNQRKLIEDLEYNISRYPHEKQVFSLLFIDIDYFKNVNDQYGHVVGSQLLIDMAAILKSQIRSSDLVYRFGGDEFIVLLPRTNIEEAKLTALRISETIKTSEFSIGDDEKYQLSLSVGMAEFPTDADSAKAIINFADQMMYLSKKSGRGKVFHVKEVVGQ